MSPLVVKLKQALADVGITAGGTQDDVILTATCYIAAIAKPEKGDWVAPAPTQFDEPEMPIDSHSSGPQFDVPAPVKPKAKSKKKVAK
jgi:hypothetical protein